MEISVNAQANCFTFSDIVASRRREWDKTLDLRDLDVTFIVVFCFWYPSSRDYDVAENSILKKRIYSTYSNTLKSSVNSFTKFYFAYKTEKNNNTRKDWYLINNFLYTRKTLVPTFMYRSVLTRESDILASFSNLLRQVHSLRRVLRLPT